MIDKQIPQKFVSDKDQRLLRVGEMIEAQNITITQRGEGEGSIVKTMKGTESRSHDTGETALDGTVKVVGQVADPQRGNIYFFCSGSSGADDMIVQYSTSTEKYKVVLAERS